MPKFEVTWTELRTFSCSSIVTADTEEDAILKAQTYDVDSDGEEIEDGTYSQKEAKVKEIGK